MKHGFWKGLLIYVICAVVLIFAGLGVFWMYMAAYEASRTDGVMDRYMETQLWPDLEQAIADFVEGRTRYEPEEAQAEALRDILESGELSYRKDPEKYHERTPVYIVLLDKRELGRIWLKSESGDLFSFGLPRWEVRSSGFNLGFNLGFDLSQFAVNYCVYAPADVAVTVNGEGGLISGVPTALPPELERFRGDLPEVPEYVVYQLGLLTVPEVDAENNNGAFEVEQGDGFSVVKPRCDAETEAELTAFCEDFVRAYIGFTSHAVEGPGIVQQYLVPGGSMYERMTASMDGMSWVHGVTASMSELSIVDYEYYGCAAILEASYVLTSGGNDTDNRMRVILTETDSGWRVANIELI